jgi:hypothetical protein
VGQQQAIMWCMLCNEAPAEGILEVYNKENHEIDYWPCCNACVNSLNDKDWITNALS